MDEVPPCGFVQDSVRGLEGVPEPEAVRAVVFKVSVNVVVPFGGRHRDFIAVAVYDRI